jgi:hypothetical protein
MRELWFGSYRSVRIECGELTLSPWPVTVRDVKFGVRVPTESSDRPADFELKRQVAEFFEYVRAVDAGEIETLEIHEGLPFSMRISHRPAQTGGHGNA